MTDTLVSEQTVRASKILFFNSLNGKFYHTAEILDENGKPTGELTLTSKEAKAPMFVKNVVTEGFGSE